MDVLELEYQIECAPSEIEAVSRDIVFEQTVELPESLVTRNYLLEEIVGKVLSIQPLSPAAESPDSNGEHPKSTSNRYSVRVAYRSELVGRQLPQLLNLLFGNISMKRNLRLSAIRFPESLLADFPGPRYGIDGVRQMLGVYGRPLLATALKPQGALPSELAQMAAEFVQGGGDIVKDDHNLHESDLYNQRERILRCRDAVAAVNGRTGRNALYLPNAMLPVDQLELFLEWVTREGISGVLISPMLLGLDTVRSMRKKFPLLLMAHPTLTGAYFHDRRHGIAPDVLLGTLFRILGADFSIFPNVGGRFTFEESDCLAIARSLRSPLGSMRSAFPSPAGGMRFETLAEMSRQFGVDSTFLIGGALLSHGTDLRVSTAQYLQEIERHFSPSYETPQIDPVSSCEISGGANTAAADLVRRHLPFTDGFNWIGREIAQYKADQSLPFRDVQRIELIGRSGEQTEYDLRYFQVEPGGYTSLEKHVHTHTVICARGQGVLQTSGQTIQLKPFDIAYVPPLESHQLRNETTEPFGFFCIVDHKRDRPRPA